MNEEYRLTKLEVAAMWLFHASYTAQGLGAKDFYAQLTESNKRIVGDMLKAILEAK